MSKSIQQRDLNVLWHPCSQMKDYEVFPPIEVKSAKGSIIYTEQGELIDVISSWWCKSLGHGHEKILDSVRDQLSRFEHVILANTTNEAIVSLCEKLIKLCPGYDKLFFCDSGSDAVEVGMKMALQYHLQTGSPQKNKFLSLENGYHGETILTLATGDCGLYGKPFESIMPKINKIVNLPYRSDYHGVDYTRGDDFWEKIEPQLERVKEELAAIVFEPVLQGAGGMLFYDPLFLKKLRGWADDNGVLLVADEILTGMGRLGYARACEMVDVLPDISVFSKGLSGGFSPIACAMTTNKIFEAFYDDYESGKAFMHSNTYCGNGVGVAASLAALTVYEEEGIFERVRHDSGFIRDLFGEISSATGSLGSIRGQGFVMAADLLDKNGRQFDSTKRVGYAVYREAVKRGALMRPLGNTLYFLPPLNASKETLQRAADIAIDSIRAVLGT